MSGPGVRSIVPLGDDVYEVVVPTREGDRTIRCTILDEDGIRGILPEPDLFMTGLADARSVTAAVLAFHDARAR